MLYSTCLPFKDYNAGGGGASGTGAGHCCHHRRNSPFAGFKQFYSSLLTGFGITDAGLSAVFGAEFYMAKSKLVCSARHKYKCCCELFKSCFIHRINAHYIIYIFWPKEALIYTSVANLCFPINSPSLRLHRCGRLFLFYFGWVPLCKCTKLLWPCPPQPWFSFTRLVPRASQTNSFHLSTEGNQEKF